MINDLKDLNGEIWKDICGYDGDYQISNLGRVKSFKKCRGIDVRILTPIKNHDGYLVVSLCKNGECETKQIHILMFESFIEKIPEGCVIHHLDFTKDNNILDNFQIMTNEEHTKIHHKNKITSEKTKKLMSGTRKEKFRNGELIFKGENHPNHILTNRKVIQIRMLIKGGYYKLKEIAKMFGVKPKTISDIKLRKIWKHI